MYKTIIRKLKSDRGDSIAEVLIAVLIVSLASLMFASVVSASQKMMSATDKYFKNYFQCRNDYESEADEADTAEYNIRMILTAKSTASHLMAGETIPALKRTIKADRIVIKEYRYGE